MAATPITPFRLGEEHRAVLTAEAERRGVTRSDVVRELIETLKPPPERPDQ